MTKCNDLKQVYLTISSRNSSEFRSCSHLSRLFLGLCRCQCKTYTDNAIPEVNYWADKDYDCATLYL